MPADIGGSASSYTLVGRTAPQHEPFVAIAAFNKAGFVDLEIDARMAERRVRCGAPSQATRGVVT
jgi:hypothetical protein